MTKTQAIMDAKNQLELPDSVTLEQIKKKYRELMRKWHPDSRGGDDAESHVMSARLTEAYRIILDYCNAYKFSFNEDDVVNQCGGEDWWSQRFGE